MQQLFSILSTSFRLFIYTITLKKNYATIIALFVLQVYPAVFLEGPLEFKNKLLRAASRFSFEGECSTGSCRSSLNVQILTVSVPDAYTSVIIVFQRYDLALVSLQTLADFVA